MKIDGEGWCDAARRVASPFFNERPSSEVSLVVVHNISLPAGEFGTGCVEDLFKGCLDCSRHETFADLEGLHVSSHFYIDRNGALTQFVSCADRAWHAGVSSFEGRENCNDFSVGIELEGSDYVPFEEAQYRTLRELIEALSEAYPISAVAGHSDIAPGRKTDPGPFFEWDRLKEGNEMKNSLVTVRYPFVK